VSGASRRRVFAAAEPQPASRLSDIQNGRKREDARARIGSRFGAPGSRAFFAQGFLLRREATEDTSQAEAAGRRRLTAPPAAGVGEAGGKRVDVEREKESPARLRGDASAFARGFVGQVAEASKDRDDEGRTRLRARLRRASGEASKASSGTHASRSASSFAGRLRRTSRRSRPPGGGDRPPRRVAAKCGDSRTKTDSGGDGGGKRADERAHGRPDRRRRQSADAPEGLPASPEATQDKMADREEAAPLRWEATQGKLGGCSEQGPPSRGARGLRYGGSSPRKRLCQNAWPEPVLKYRSRSAAVVEFLTAT
jgi:hypothetical protein